MPAPPDSASRRPGRPPDNPRPAAAPPGAWLLLATAPWWAAACRAGTSTQLVAAAGVAPPSSTDPNTQGGTAHTGTDPNAAADPNTPADPNTVANPNTVADPNAAGACAGIHLGICDDFETTPIGGPPDPALWQVVTQNPTARVVVETGRVLQGSRSLHLTCDNHGFERAVVVNKTFFPAPSNQIFGRALLFIDSAIPMIHFDLVSGSGVLPGQDATTTVNIGGQYGIFLANYYNAQDPAHILDLWQHAGVQAGGSWTDATPVPTNRWACLEWQFSGAGNQMNMWLDGQAVARMHVDGQSADCCPGVIWQQPPFEALSFGWTVVANSEPIAGFSLWLDSIALGSSRIGCGG